MRKLILFLLSLPAFSQWTATQGQPVSTAAATFSATGLPSGLSMSSTGAITGTPTVSGTYNYTVSMVLPTRTVTFTDYVTISASPPPPPPPPPPTTASIVPIDKWWAIEVDVNGYPHVSCEEVDYYFYPCTNLLTYFWMNDSQMNYYIGLDSVGVSMFFPNIGSGVGGSGYPFPGYLWRNQPVTSANEPPPAPMGLGGKLTYSFHYDAPTNPAALWDHNSHGNNPGGSATIRPIFSSEFMPWIFQFYTPPRIYSTVGLQLSDDSGKNIRASGDYTLTVTLDPSLWVTTSGTTPTAQEFATALAKPSSIGFVCGGGDSYGHGCAIHNGSATIKLKGITYQP